VVVRLIGDADLSTAPMVTDALSRAAGLHTPQVVVDVAGAHFWDCSGLHALACFTRELSVAGRACRIVGALPATRRLIAMANLAGRLQLDGVAARRATLAENEAAVPAHRPVSGHPLAVRVALATAGRGR
jgi:anti-anti-sigma factor